MDRNKTAFRDADGRLFEFFRAGICLTVLPDVFIRIEKRALGNPPPDVGSWLDGIMISCHMFREHITAVADILTKLSNVRLSGNYEKCRFAASS